MTRNLEDTVDLALKRVAHVMTTRRDAFEIPALKELEGAMKQRIHNKGKDVTGERIGVKGRLAGKYSPAYERRKKAGGVFNGRRFAGTGEANIYPINLQLHGDLMKGFTVGDLSGQNVLEFQDELSRTKAGRHEEEYNTVIYKPSDDELEGFTEVWLDQFEDVLKEAFR